MLVIVAFMLSVKQISNRAESHNYVYKNLLTTS